MKNSKKITCFGFPVMPSFPHKKRFSKASVCPLVGFPELSRN